MLIAVMEMELNGAPEPTGGVEIILNGGVVAHLDASEIDIQFGAGSPAAVAAKKLTKKVPGTYTMNATIQLDAEDAKELQSALDALSKNAPAGMGRVVLRMSVAAGSSAHDPSERPVLAHARHRPAGVTMAYRAAAPCCPVYTPPVDRRDALRCLCGHAKKRHTVRSRGSNLVSVGGACKSCEVKHERFAEHPRCLEFKHAIGTCKVCRTDRATSDLTDWGVCDSTIASELCLRNRV